MLHYNGAHRKNFGWYLKCCSKYRRLRSKSQRFRSKSQEFRLKSQIFRQNVEDFGKITKYVDRNQKIGGNLKDCSQLLFFFVKISIWLEIAQIRYYTAKQVFLWVLQWKSSFVQLPTLSLTCTNAIIHHKHVFLSILKREIRFVQLSSLILNRTHGIFHYKKPLFKCFEVDNWICASVDPDLKLHKCGIPLQNTSFCAFVSRQSAVCKCQL